MRLKTWYKIHKWISVAMGLVLFLWLFTGLAMILPASRVARSFNRPPPIDYGRLGVNPAAAVARAREVRSFDRPIREVSIVPLLDDVAYRIAPQRGRAVLISAITGRPIEIDEPTAVELAKSTFDAAGEVERVEYLTRHSASYLGGALPIWRVWFAGGVAVHIDAADGRVRNRSGRVDRFREANAQIHSFGPLRLGPGGSATQHGSLWITGLISLLTVMTGYYLSLPKRWKVRRRPPTT